MHLTLKKKVCAVIRTVVTVATMNCFYFKNGLFGMSGRLFYVILLYICKHSDGGNTFFYSH